MQSRAATSADLKAVIQALNANGVDYLLIGGYALAVQGYQRATTDIDIVIPGNQEMGSRLKRALLILPWKSGEDIELPWFDENENIRVADEIHIDIMLNANGYSYDTLKPFAETVEYDGVAVQTLSLEGLLMTKQTLRDKDVQDRLIIEHAQAQLNRQQLNL